MNNLVQSHDITRVTPPHPLEKESVIIRSEHLLSPDFTRNLGLLTWCSSDDFTSFVQFWSLASFEVVLRFIHSDTSSVFFSTISFALDW